MAEADTEKMFSVLHLVLDSGERLPCLVDAETWIRARVALRWAMRYRRYRVQSSTLAANLRVLAKLYRWTQEIGGFDLDDRLIQGRTLQNHEIESLARSFRGASTQELDTGAELLLQSRRPPAALRVFTELALHASAVFSQVSQDATWVSNKLSSLVIHFSHPCLRR